MSRTSARTPLLKAVAVCLGLLGALLALEGLFRLLPVSEVMLSLPVNAANPMLRFVPDRTVNWSRGAWMTERHTLRVNNYGFLNGQDYDPASASPLVAVVGDSFIEAVALPYGQTSFARLAQALNGRARVYSFGRSGAPLSHYLACAQWLVPLFRPDRLVILAVANDFDESLLEYKRAPGYHYYQDDGQGGLRLLRVDYTPGRFSGLARHSRLLSYLLVNLQVQGLWARLSARWAGDSAFVGQTLAAAEQRRVERSRLVVDTVLKELPLRTGLAPKDICLVTDGLRPNLYTAQGRRDEAGSFARLMLDYLLAQARRQGFRTIDMEPLFVADFAAHGQPFDFGALDAHWNARGHAVLAQALLDSGFLDGLGGGQPDAGRP
ncbi:MAG: hypothetical protein AB9900_01330 [Humidesulfovibrio sp.]